MQYRCCKTLLAFVLMLPAIFGGAGMAGAADTVFPDVPGTHPEHDAIQLLRRMNAIGGFEDRTFRPDLPATRAGVVQIALLASGQLPAVLRPGQPIPYPDVAPNAPSAGFIVRAAEKGYLSPDGKTPFRPNEPATRAEGLKLALTVFGVKPAVPATAPYSDVDVKSWEAPYAAYAKEHRLFRTTGSGLLPSAPLRRSELAQIVATLYRERVDAARPAFPWPIAVPLLAGWLLCAIPLLRFAAARRWAGWQRALGMAGAVLLGPIGAVGRIAHRLATLRVRDEGEGEAPQRRRPLGRRSNGAHLLRWLHASEPQLLTLLLVLGYIVVLAQALRIMATTSAIQSSLTALAHG